MALYASNRAWWYVERVVGIAVRYVDGEWDPEAPRAPLDVDALLNTPRLKVYPGGAGRLIAAGRIDARCCSCSRC